MKDFNKVQTKGVVNEDLLTKLSYSIAKSIIDMPFQNVKDVSAVVKSQIRIYYSKDHIAKLG